MNYKHKVKTKASSLKAVLLGSLAGIAVQLLGGAVVAMLVEQGSVPETRTSVCAIAIRVIAILAATLVTWWTSPEKKITDASVAAGIVMLLPLIASLLFWGIDAGAFTVGFAVSAVAFGGCVWVVSRPKKGRVWQPVKKRYR